MKSSVISNVSLSEMKDVILSEQSVSYKDILIPRITSLYLANWGDAMYGSVFEIRESRHACVLIDRIGVLVHEDLWE